MSDRSVAAHGDRSEAARRAYPSTIVWPLTIGSSLNALNTSMVATAIIPIATELAVGPGSVIALVAVLYVSSAVAQPVFGSLADRIGPRRTFVAGMAIAAVGGVVGGCATSLAGLLVARALAGIGTAAGYPSAMALLRQRETSTNVSVPPRVLGASAVAVQVAAAVGLPMGGLLTAVVGWRATFWINVPAGLVLAAAALRWFPGSPGGRAATGSLARLLDPIGVGLFATLVSALSFALLPDPREHWQPYGVAALALVALVTWEWRVAVPFLDVGVLRAAPGLGRTLLRNFLTFVAMYCYLYGITQWLQGERGLDALGAALLLAPMATLSIAIATIATGLRTAKAPLMVGSAAGVGGALMLTALGAGLPLWWVVPASLSMGLMTGLTAVANQATMFVQAPPARIGAAAGMMRAASNVAAIVASGLIAYWYPVRADDVGLEGISLTMSVLVGAVLVLTLGDRQLATTRGAS